MLNDDNKDGIPAKSKYIYNLLIIIIIFSFCQELCFGVFSYTVSCWLLLEQSGPPVDNRRVCTSSPTLCKSGTAFSCHQKFLLFYFFILLYFSLFFTFFILPSLTTTNLRVWYSTYYRCRLISVTPTLCKCF